MKGNFQVRFLEGWPPATGAGYSAGDMETVLSHAKEAEQVVVGHALGQIPPWAEGRTVELYEKKKRGATGKK
jgi:hypothetical protein